MNVPVTVFPVPGGPCIRVNELVRDACIAVAWPALGGVCNGGLYLTTSLATLAIMGSVTNMTWY